MLGGVVVNAVSCVQSRSSFANALGYFAPYSSRNTLSASFASRRVGASMISESGLFARECRRLGRQSITFPEAWNQQRCSPAPGRRRAAQRRSSAARPPARAVQRERYPLVAAPTGSVRTFVMACLPFPPSRRSVLINREGTPPLSSTPSTTFGYSPRRALQPKKVRGQSQPAKEGQSLTGADKLALLADGAKYRRSHLDGFWLNFNAEAASLAVVRGSAL